jgi:hypothetical protein
MRTVLGFMLVLLASVTASAAWPADRDPRMIVPGERIGSAHLGMHRSMIDAINRNSLCPVLATYHAAGDSTRLETNWGGGCRVSHGIALRVLGWHSGTTIQAIAVFPELAARDTAHGKGNPIISAAASVFLSMDGLPFAPNLRRETPSNGMGRSRHAQ